MDINSLHGVHKPSFKATIDHHGLFVFWSLYYLCRAIVVIDTKNSSTTYLEVYTLNTMCLRLGHGRWRFRQPMALERPVKKSRNTGPNLWIAYVFLPDDLKSHQRTSFILINVFRVVHESWLIKVISFWGMYIYPPEVGISVLLCRRIRYCYLSPNGELYFSGFVMTQKYELFDILYICHSWGNILSQPIGLFWVCAVLMLDIVFYIFFSLITLPVMG